MKIAITARDFSVQDDSAVAMLKAAGHEIYDFSDLDMGSGTHPLDIQRAVLDADIAITGLEPYSEDVIKKCPNLKLIARRGIGYDSVDINACKAHGVTLTRTVGAIEGSVAEHIMAYILHFARRIDLQNADMQDAFWNRMITPGAKTRRLGLVGFGGIGKEVARRARPFGMDIVYYCRNPKPEWDAEFGARYLPLDELLATSDYVSVSLPMNDETTNMFDEAMFRKMKRGSIFINTARGGVMDEYALRDAVKNGLLGGAAVDVFRYEPCDNSPLIGIKNIVLTPHTAPYTEENFSTMNRIAAQNVLDFIDGKLEAKYIVV